MQEIKEHGDCKGCSAELVSVWSRATETCPRYVSRTNISEEDEDLCRGCYETITNHPVYRYWNERRDIYTSVYKGRCTIYCAEHGEELGVFDID